VIIGANALCLFFLANLLTLKLREFFGAERPNLLPRPGEGGRGATG
jgi:hypothetical protein